MSVLALLLLLGLLARPPRIAKPFAAEPPAVRRPAAAASAVAALRAQPPAHAAQPHATRPPEPGEAQSCGLGIVQQLADPSSSPLAEMQRDARPVAWRALAARTEPRLRAVGRYYESRMASLAAGDEAARSISQDCGPAAETPGCRAQADAMAAALSRSRQAGAPAANRLAEWASASGDPLIYALALRACRPGDASFSGACEQLSNAQWARLDPGNGVPWMFLAEEARQRGDEAAEAEAYHRASQATAYATGWGALPALVDEGLAGTMPEPARMLIDLDAWALQGDFIAPPYLGLTRYCGAANVIDANRRQTCESLANLLLRRGSFLDSTVALSLGGPLGWPEPRLHQLREEQKLLMRASASTDGDADSALDCRSAQRRRERAQLTWQLGEAGAARERVKRSGRSATQLIAEAGAHRASATEPLESAAGAR